MAMENVPSQAALQGNLWRYKLIAAIAFTPIMLPIIVLFWQECGLDMFEVFVLQALFAGAVVLLEVPTGMVADRLGKRTSLIIALIIVFLGCVGYAMSRTFWSFLFVEVLLAFGAAFFSGADTALLYDTLKALKREGEFKQLEGEANAIRLISFAICNLLGGFIGDWSLVAAMWATAVGPFLALFVVFGFVEVNPRDKGASFRDSLLGYRRLILSALKFVRRHEYVRWQIMFYSVLMGSGTWLLWLYQPYMSFSGLDVWAFGAAFALFNLFAALCSRHADDFEKRAGPGKANLAMMALQVLPLLLMSRIVRPMSFVFIFMHQAVRGILRPLVADRVLRYTFADKRATVLSLNTMGSRLFFVMTGPLVGWISDSQPLPVVLDVQAVALFVIFVVLVWMYQKIPSKYFQIKDSVTDNQ